MQYVLLEDDISKLPLSVRILNVLRRNGVNTIYDMLQSKKNKKLKNFVFLGKKGVSEIEQWVENLSTGVGDYCIAKNEDEIAVCRLDNATSRLKIPVSELPFSRRAVNALMKAGIKTSGDLYNINEENLVYYIKTLNSSDTKEILAYINQENIQSEDYDTVAASKDEIPENEDNYLIKELSEAYKLNSDVCSKIITDTTLNFPEAQGESLIYHLYENKKLNNALHNKLLYILKKNEEGVSLENFMSKVPVHLRNTTIVEEMLLTMEQQNELYLNKNDVYIRIYPSIIDYIKTINDEKKRQILLGKFDGKTLQEIGDRYGITRERVRQICNKELRLIHKKGQFFREDKYRYFFSNYSISKDDFILAFNEPSSTYEYLKAITTENSFIKPLEDVLEDENISTSMKKQLERVIYKDYITINGQRINNNRPSLVYYYVKTYCKKITKYEDFEQGYKNFLNNLGLLSYNLELHGHTYENSLSDCMYVLWSQWRRFRYYDISSRNYDDLLKNIDIMQYDGLEISTLKLFRENSALMEEYDIQDEYELHNLLKKIWDKSDTKVNFKRMPTIEIGTVDRDAQIWSLLLQYAPVSSETFGALYEELYGAKAATVNAGYMKNFDKYFFNGIYSINVQDLSENEYFVLSKVLNDDYYTMQDVQRIYLREFPEADKACINSYTLKKLGFRVYFGYVIRNTYARAVEYFNKILTEHDTVDMRKYSSSIQHINAYNSEMHRLLKEREIVEFAPYQYINIRKLNQFGVTKETMEDYCKAVRNFVKPGAFFTIRSIISDGFSHSLDLIGFDETFYSSVLLEDKVHFSCHKFGTTRVFINGISENIVTDMLKQLIEKDGKINIYNLIDLLKNHYGLIVDKSKLVSKIRSTDMYYDTIMETVYIDYNKYFEEV